MRRLGIAAVLVGCSTALPSCSTTATATLTVTTGEETDAFSRAPAPTTLVVESVDLQGHAQELARAALPADTISLGDKGRTDVGAIRVRGLDAAGKTLLFGETLYVQFGALENAALEVFVQRVGELARMPNAPAALDAPRLGMVVARYILAASGTSAFLYDVLLDKPASALPVLARPARSLATFGTAAIVIDEAGASTLDLSSGTSTTLAAPAGGTFAEIAGGATVATADTVYVVGGTRIGGGPSSRILVIANDGTTTFASLAKPREGACATFVTGRGLVVYGGNTTDGGAEVLAPGAAIATPLPFPADATKGCGASALDATHVLVVGGAGSALDVAGAAPARILDLACADKCTPAPWPGALGLVRAEAFTLAPNAAIVAGDDATGASHVFRVTDSGPTEITLKAARRGAHLVALPVAGTVAIVGGAAAIEQYRE
jgi:hypothetical protein